MVSQPRSRARVLLLAALMTGSIALGGCSSDGEEDAAEPRDTVFVVPGVTCDHDISSPQAQSINERVGGLQTPEFTVNFAQSTRLGTVTLVTGDLQEAIDTLTGDYGVSLVAELEDDGSDRIVGFEQVRTLVDDVCGKV